MKHFFNNRILNLPEFIFGVLINIPPECNTGLIMVNSFLFIMSFIAGKNRVGLTVIQGNSWRLALLTGRLYLSSIGLNLRLSDTFIATEAKPSGSSDAFNPKMSASDSVVLDILLITGVVI